MILKIVEGVTTRVQKEVRMFLKELELFSFEMVIANEQLRKDMNAKWEATNMETRKMFSQLCSSLRHHKVVDLPVLETLTLQNRKRIVY